MRILTQLVFLALRKFGSLQIRSYAPCFISLRLSPCTVCLSGASLSASAQMYAALKLHPELSKRCSLRARRSILRATSSHLPLPTRPSEGFVRPSLTRPVLPVSCQGRLHPVQLDWPHLPGPCFAGLPVGAAVQRARPGGDAAAARQRGGVALLLVPPRPPPPLALHALPLPPPPVLRHGAHHRYGLRSCGSLQLMRNLKVVLQLQLSILAQVAVDAQAYL